MKHLLPLLNFRDQSLRYSGYPHYGPLRIASTAYPFTWQTQRNADRRGRRAKLWMRVMKAGRMYRGCSDDFRP